jgi:hypothetical protein
MDTPSENNNANVDEAPAHVDHDADPRDQEDALTKHEIKHAATVGRFMDTLDELAEETTHLDAHNEFTTEEVDRVDVAVKTIQDFFRGRVKPA